MDGYNVYGVVMALQKVSDVLLKKRWGKLINKKDFFNIVWVASVCKPLNRRLVGSFEEYIKQLSSVVTDPNYFERPSWWLALIADKLDNK